MRKLQTSPVRHVSPWTCPVCGRPFTAVDMVMYEHEDSYQCRYCWNRVKHSGTTQSPFTSSVRRVRMSRS